MAGLGAAWALSKHPDRFDIRVFEANDRIGGNAITVDMPQENGLRVLEYIRGRAELRLLPVIILTGHPVSSTIENAYRLGANAFHEKPVNFEEMVTLVQGLYGAWSQSRRPVL